MPDVSDHFCRTELSTRPADNLILVNPAWVPLLDSVCAPGSCLALVQIREPAHTPWAGSRKMLHLGDSSSLGRKYLTCQSRFSAPRL